jgi:hypothetical protein
MDFSYMLTRLLPALLAGLLFGPILIAAAVAHYVYTMSRELAHGRAMEALRIQTDLEMAMLRDGQDGLEQSEQTAPAPDIDPMTKEVVCEPEPPA